MVTREQWMKDIGVEWPLIKLKGPNTAPYRIADDLLFITGVGPSGDDGELAFRGKIGAELSAEEGYNAARLAGLNALRLIKDALGGLERVDYVVKSMALVSAAPGYQDLFKAADGFSDVLTEALGDRGLHARNAVGASVLDGNSPVICDVIVKIL